MLLEEATELQTAPDDLVHSKCLADAIEAVPEKKVLTQEERAEIVHNHGQMVVRTAKYYQQQAPYRIDLRDLVQAGWCGFLQALNKWDPSKGVTVGAYCSPWVRGSIHRFVFGNKIPRPVWESSFYQLKTRQSIGHHEDLSITEPFAKPEIAEEPAVFVAMIDISGSLTAPTLQRIKQLTSTKTVSKCAVFTGDDAEWLMDRPNWGPVEDLEAREPR